MFPVRHKMFKLWLIKTSEYEEIFESKSVKPLCKEQSHILLCVLFELLKMFFDASMMQLSLLLQNNTFLFVRFYLLVKF